MIARNTCQRCGQPAVAYNYIYKDQPGKQVIRFYYRCVCGKKFKRDYNVTRPDRDYYFS